MKGNLPQESLYKYGIRQVPFPTYMAYNIRDFLMAEGWLKNLVVLALLFCARHPVMVKQQGPMKKLTPPHQHSNSKYIVEFKSHLTHYPVNRSKTSSGGITLHNWLIEVC